MSPTSTNRSPRCRLTDVGDSDLEAVKPRHKQKCLITVVKHSSRDPQKHLCPEPQRPLFI
ncbi:MAG: hypothetical protein K2H92_01510 [Bacteroidaceae bacterium]|nr:hypothetical protein [Bacteroidaceae bacterium]